jgi:hypothetical protein
MFGHYFVYLMGSANGRAVYAGMTNDLIRRVREHKSGEIPGFTKRYRCHMLLYYEDPSIYFDVPNTESAYLTFFLCIAFLSQSLDQNKRLKVIQPFT